MQLSFPFPRTPPNPCVQFLLAWLGLFLNSASAQAHGVGLECRVHGSKVWIYAFFDDETDAADAEIVVLSGEREIARGKTDRKGEWHFDRPAPGKYSVLLDAGAGHKTRTTITVRDEGATSETPQQISEGPGREEATRYPWLGVALGLAIVGVGCACWLLLRGRRP